MRIEISKKNEFIIFNEVMRWIMNENQNIYFKFKVYFSKEVIELQDAIEFLNSNCIIELLLNELHPLIC